MLARELLARNVTALRLERGLSLVALAEASGLTPYWIKKISGKHVSTGIDVLDALAIALGVPVAALFADPPRPAPPAMKRGRKRKDR